MNVDQRIAVGEVLETILDVSRTVSEECHYHRQTWIGYLARLDGLTTEVFLADTAKMDDATRGAAFGHGLAALNMPLSPYVELAMQIAGLFPKFDELSKARRERLVGYHVVAA